MHLLGYSFGGPLACELALCLQNGPLDCKSLCLVDPTPICNSPRPETPQHPTLLERAKRYDFLFSVLLQTEANLEQAVILKDIVTMTDLEVSAS